MLRLFVPYKLFNCPSGYLVGWHDTAASYHKHGTHQVITVIVWGISKTDVRKEVTETIGVLGQFQTPTCQVKFRKQASGQQQLFIHLMVNHCGYIDVTHLRMGDRTLLPSKDCCIFLFNPPNYLCLMPGVIEKTAFKTQAPNDPCLTTGSSPIGDWIPHKRPDMLSMFTASLTEFQTSSVSSLRNEHCIVDFTSKSHGFQLEGALGDTVARSILSILSPLALVLNSTFQFWPMASILNFTATYSTLATQLKTRILQLHYLGNKANEKQNLLKYWNTFGAIVVDILLGIVLTMVIHRNLSSTVMLDLFLEYTSILVGNLRILLVWLMGVPAGLKLNLPLSSAMGTFFLFHIQLWEAYLYVITPTLEVMLDLATYCGIFGVTFQLSMLTDLLALATFHINCFYAYAARIYNIAIRSLGSTWRIFRGKKWNPLRQRVDSCTYDVDQLFMGTLSFTVLFFLLPTVALYYVVFTMIRLPVLVIQDLIFLLMSSISRLPVYTTILYLVKSKALIGSITLDIIKQHVSHDRPIVFHVKENVCSFRVALCDFLPPMDYFRPKLSWKQFITNLLTGRLVHPM